VAAASPRGGVHRGRAGGCHGAVARDGGSSGRGRMVLRRPGDEGFARRKSCLASGRAGSDDVQWTPCSPLGRCRGASPPGQVSLGENLPEFTQVGGGGALGVVPPLEASPLENLFRCSRGLWRSAAASPSSEVSLLENQPTQYMTLMSGWRQGVVSSLSPGCLQRTTTATKCSVGQRQWTALAATTS